MLKIYFESGSLCAHNEPISPTIQYIERERLPLLRDVRNCYQQRHRPLSSLSFSSSSLVVVLVVVGCLEYWQLLFGRVLALYCLSSSSSSGSVMGAVLRMIRATIDGGEMDNQYITWTLHSSLYLMNTIGNDDVLFPI